MLLGGASRREQKRAVGTIQHLHKRSPGEASSYQEGLRKPPLADLAIPPRGEYTTQIAHRPAPSEVASWQRSLQLSRQLLAEPVEVDGWTPTSP
jgi:hypothetical protein